jgi:hypothetical protein
MSMWWRILIPLTVGLLLELGLAMLAGNGLLGPYGWTITLIVSSALGGSLAGALAPPRSSLRTPKRMGKHSTPRS